MVKRIAVMTTGGDAPGMNAAIRGVVRTAIGLGMEVYGIEEGFSGLLQNMFKKMESYSVSNIVNKGGTILRTVRSKDFRLPEKRKEAYSFLKRNLIEGLVVIGGDGSRMGAYTVTKETGLPTVFIPASIDNDVYGTDFTIGFDTAVNVALEAIDKIRDTAASHERVFIVELMGREHGFLTLECGITGGAEIILIPEFKKDFNLLKIANSLQAGIKRGKSSSIIVMAEGLGSGIDFAVKLEKKLGFEVRCSVLGYIQRGGTPTARSRKLGLSFGYNAVKLIKKMKTGESKMVGIQGEKIVIHEMKDVTGKERDIDKDSYEMNKIFSL
ncbi:MAG: ATP-dependent 6-phosphofructokinase [Candidatus Goldiibacteriota bacterium HGW-Goldbacteria-1]|jgi:6-phosphofructokinase 1|nr:MAG: ATP-dependent 6-phosphofructokinase [Candidatus Goldiibacteriota bacterium HGW-Goldbacteria-1]